MNAAEKVAAETLIKNENAIVRPLDSVIPGVKNPDFAVRGKDGAIRLVEVLTSSATSSAASEANRIRNILKALMSKQSQAGNLLIDISAQKVLKVEHIVAEAQKLWDLPILSVTVIENGVIVKQLLRPVTAPGVKATVAGVVQLLIKAASIAGAEASAPTEPQ
jgi:hypothetical protein